MKTPPPPPLFKFICNVHPSSLSPPTPTPTALSVVLLLWLNGWSDCHIWCAILLNDIMDLNMLSLGTSVPERTWCVFYALRHQVYWSMTHVFFCQYFDLISHSQKDTQHTQGPLEWHNQIKIYLQDQLCAHSSYLYYIEWIIHWNQKFTFQCFFFWKIIYL